MTRFSKALTSVGLGLALVAAAVAFAPSALQKSLQAKYNAAGQGVSQGNFKLLEAGLDPSFVLKDDVHHTTVNRANFLRELEKIAKTSRHFYLAATIDSLSSKGKTAIAKVSYRTTVIYNKAGGQGVDKRNTLSTARDFWVNTASGWKLKSSRILTSKVVKAKEFGKSLPMGGGHKPARMPLPKKG